MTKPANAWACVNTKSEILCCTVSDTKLAAIDACWNIIPILWDDLRRKSGFRCVRVRIEVVEKKP